MTRWLRSALLLLLAVPVLTLVAPSPAYACSCAMGSVEDYVKWSDAVFVATLAEPLAEGTTGVVRARASVETVYDGDVPDEVIISTGAQGSACGLTGLDAGERWLFYATNGKNGTFGVSLCGGSTVAGPGRVTEVETVLGQGRTVATTATSGSGSQDVSPPSAEPTAVPEGGDTVPVAIGLGLVVALVGGIGVWLVVRRRIEQG